MAGTTYTECDHRDCNARAYVETILDTGKPLHFCAHHYGVLEEALAAYTVTVYDHRDLLTQEPEPVKVKA